MSKQKILIVDDDPNISELISLYLVKEFFEPRTCEDGQAALDLFRSWKPDLIHLHTEGTITSSGMYATGLIAGTKDGSNITVENCVSSMTLSNTDSDEKTLSGLVGRIEDVTLTIRGCVFNGSLTGSTDCDTFIRINSLVRLLVHFLLNCFLNCRNT